MLLRDLFDNNQSLQNKLVTAALSIEYAPSIDDKRPNDLADEINHPNYSNWGYHTKDYHIYGLLWSKLI